MDFQGWQVVVCYVIGFVSDTLQSYLLMSMAKPGDPGTKDSNLHAMSAPHQSMLTANTGQAHAQQHSSQQPSSRPQSSNTNTVGVHYKIGRKIGEGSFGIIYEGSTSLTHRRQSAQQPGRRNQVRAKKV